MRRPAYEIKREVRPQAHFSMSPEVKDLACAYTHAVDFRVLREALRVRRERLGWTLDRLADESGLNRATIHSIENVKREPRLKPRLATIERLGAAMGLTLSLSDQPAGSHNRPEPKKGAAAKISPGAIEQTRAGHDPTVSTPDEFTNLRGAIGSFEEALIERLRAIGTRSQQTAGRRPAVPARTKGRRKSA